MIGASVRLCLRIAALATVMTGTALASAAAASPSVAHDEKSDTILHVFDGSDGQGPNADLVSDGNGNFYGTTSIGGSQFNGGTIFRIASDGTFSSLYSFSDTSAYYPTGSVVLDRKGNLFGATLMGGTERYGSIYRLSPDGSLTVLYTFLGNDGSYPNGGLLKMGELLYGITEGGGKGKNCGLKSGCGLIFSISPKGMSEKMIYAFQGGNDGSIPVAGLTKDASGNLYGTTSSGGGTCNNNYCGTVFKLASNGTKTILHTFSGSSDGARPVSRLTLDSQGNLYGAAANGGGNGCPYEEGCGTVFKIASDGTFSVLHAFGGGSDGAFPGSDLLIDDAGDLYGTTGEGGGSIHCKGQGCGTVFRIAPDGTETILHVFAGKDDGRGPSTGLTAYKGHLYGATASSAPQGGSCGRPKGCGTVYSIRP